ncbi:MAG: FAD:protein FMN transferase, partial [Kangiellaceae bacterium]
MRLLFFTAILLLSITSCEDKSEFVDELKYRQVSGFTMGTTYQITIESTQEIQELIKHKIDVRLVEINQLMSTYIDNSELSLFNKNQSSSCIPMSAENLLVIAKAVEVGKQTNGKFDVTLDPLIKEWGFDTKQTNERVPDDETIEKLLEQIGFSKLNIQDSCISKNTKELSVNLSAIAKGYAVDQIANLITNHGVQNYLVEIGGETASKGINSRSKNWRLAIEAPVEQ